VQRISLTTMVLVTLAVTVTCAQAATDWDLYYQFRHVSTLPGNAFGVTPEGAIGFDGALQQNIPVAYTPCADNYIVGFWSGSTSSSLEFGFSGADVNGTATIGLGFGRPGHGIYFSDMFTGSDWCAAYNFQFQIMPETAKRPAVAIGVNDILNQRQKVLGIPYGARSIYVTSTWKAGSPDQPYYVTAGWGGGRFDSGPFGGMSYGLSDHITALIEYDGLNTNAGLAYGLAGRSASDSRWNGIGYIGYSDLDRPVIGGCITYSR